MFSNTVELRISCKCTKYTCKVEFPIIHSDELLNLLQYR